LAGNGEYRAWQWVTAFLSPWPGSGDEDPIERAKAAVLAILGGDNPCADFFSKNGSNDAYKDFATSPITTYNGPNYYTPFVDANGKLNAYLENGFMKPGPGGTGAIELNQNGAFFQQSAYEFKPDVVTPSPRRVPAYARSFRGNTLGAQILTMLHEFAHIEGVIDPDNGPISQAATKSGNNTALVEKNCLTAIQDALKAF